MNTDKVFTKRWKLWCPRWCSATAAEDDDDDSDDNIDELHRLCNKMQSSDSTVAANSYIYLPQLSAPVRDAKARVLTPRVSISVCTWELSQGSVLKINSVFEWGIITG